MESIKQICKPSTIPYFTKLDVFNNGWSGLVYAETTLGILLLRCSGGYDNTVIYDIDNCTEIYKSCGILNPEAILLLIDNLLTRSVK